MMITVQTSGNCNLMKGDLKAGFLSIMSEHLFFDTFNVY